MNIIPLLLSGGGPVDGSGQPVAVMYSSVTATQKLCQITEAHPAPQRTYIFEDFYKGSYKNGL